MQFRKLGNTDLRIAPLVLGGNVFGWTADKQQRPPARRLPASDERARTEDSRRPRRRRGAPRATPAQVALSWIMARPSVVAPIASATSLAQLGDILRSVDLRLSAEDMAALDI